MDKPEQQSRFPRPHRQCRNSPWLPIPDRPPTRRSRAGVTSGLPRALLALQPRSALQPVFAESAALYWPHQSAAVVVGKNDPFSRRVGGPQRHCPRVSARMAFGAPPTNQYLHRPHALSSMT